MNILHLKYAVEVERTGSITQAAETLYMGQPNLSKAIRELENSIGIVIFKRTPKGVTPTVRGEEFLRQAKKVLAQIEHMEAVFMPGSKERQSLSVSVPRATYIAEAFTSFVQMMNSTEAMDLDYKETNSMQAIHNIIQDESSIAFIRYPLEQERYFQHLLDFKNLDSAPIWEFEHRAVMSERHPLARANPLRYEDMIQYTELTHGDNENPYVPVREAVKIKDQPSIKRKIFIYDRGSQFDILVNVPTSYMWVSPIPSEVLQRYGLVQLKCESPGNRYKDVLVYKKGYRLSSPELLFVNEVKRLRDAVAEDNQD